jgi:hypothetical protein
LQKKYGNKVKYIYLNPPPAAIEYVNVKNISGVEFRDWYPKSKMNDFYNEIDVFAHARRDGETFGVAILEAKLNLNPIITHRSRQYNSHLDLLKSNFSKIANIDNYNEYFEHMEFFYTNKKNIYSIGLMAREHAILLFSPDAIFHNLLNDILLIKDSNLIVSTGFVFYIEIVRSIKYYLHRIFNLIIKFSINISRS